MRIILDAAGSNSCGHRAAQNSGAKICANQLLRTEIGAGKVAPNQQSISEISTRQMRIDQRHLRPGEKEHPSIIDTLDQGPAPAGRDIRQLPVQTLLYHSDDGRIPDRAGCHQRFYQIGGSSPSRFLAFSPARSLSLSTPTLVHRRERGEGTVRL